MDNRRVYRLGGILGIVACVITVLEFPLWGVGGGAPWVVDASTLAAYVSRVGPLFVTRSLMDMIIFVLLAAFVVVFRKAIVDTDSRHEWLATLFVSLATIYIAVTLVADAFGAAMGLDAYGGGADATILRGMAEVKYILFGSIGLILIGSMMTVAGALVWRTRVFRRWMAWVSFAVALLNFGFVPTMYFGSDPRNFYSTSGIGAPTVATFPFLVWILITSILMVKG